MRSWISPIRSFHTFCNVPYLFLSQSSTGSIIDLPIQWPRVVFNSTSTFIFRLPSSTLCFSLFDMFQYAVNDVRRSHKPEMNPLLSSYFSGMIYRSVELAL